MRELTIPWSDEEFFIYRGHKLVYTHTKGRIVVRFPGGLSEDSEDLMNRSKDCRPPVKWRNEPQVVNTNQRVEK